MVTRHRKQYIVIMNICRQPTGEWLAGRRHGFGEQIYADGSRYEGQWADGLQDGHGVMAWKKSAVQYCGMGHTTLKTLAQALLRNSCKAA